MNIRIYVHYQTAWGEEMALRVGKKRFPMGYTFDGIWQVTLTGRDLKDGSAYTYEVLRDGQPCRKEWRSHLYTAPAEGKEVIIRDRWNDRPSNSTFFSSAFSDVIFRRPDGASFRHPRPEKAAPKGNVTFRIAAPEVRGSQSVALVGSGPALGNWKKVHLLSDARFPYWEITLPVSGAFEYKFAIVDTRSKEILLWENGPDHLLAEVPAPGSHLVIADATPSFPTQPWRGAGVAVPVFALRTQESFGVGEFLDIPRLVDWAVASGQNLIQLLPINDTTMTRTWVDSYPYNAVSSFALHPMFLNLPAAGVRRDARYRALKEELEALPAIDYEKVVAAKEELLRKVFESRGGEVLQSEAYRHFVEQNMNWLQPYAAFCALRDEKGNCDFSTWGEFAKYSARKIDAYIADHTDEVNFYCYEQYLLDVQLKEAVRYAHTHGIALKGDLPIGVSRHSVDAWHHPELFHMDSQAGAPPDAFSADGQNWGFPTYDWDKMAEDDFAWWKARLRKMAEYFDAYRIDHILGFFRIWEIPMQYKSGLMGHFSPALPYSTDELAAAGFNPGDGEGADVLFVEDPRRKGFWHPRIGAQHTNRYNYLADWQKDRYNQLYNDFFYHRHNQFWKESAYRKLPSLLRSTGMLSCGEDLGMIPSCVPDTMADLNILSLEIQRMPKDPKDEFARPESYPYYSVCATGTHDTSPLRAWWEEDRGLTQRFYNQVLGCGGDAPYFCEPWVVEKIIRQHLDSPSMLVVLPLQDWLAIDGEVRYQGNPSDERINVPAIPRYYWRYRMHCTLESLLEKKELSEKLCTMTASSGRNH